MITRLWHTAAVTVLALLLSPVAIRADWQSAVKQTRLSAPRPPRSPP